MAFLFADYDRDQEIVVWCPAENAEVHRHLYHKYGYSQVQTIPAFSAKYEQNGRDHFILIFQTERYFNSCHACTVVLGGAIFVKKDGQWYLAALTRAMTTAGCYGTAPSDMALVKVGPEGHAVAVRDGYRQHGIYFENFLLLGPVGDRVEEILFLPGSSGNNDGRCGDPDGTPFSLPKCYHFDLDIAFCKGSHPIYSDIELTIEGTRYDDHDTFSSFEKVAVYHFDGCRYTNGARIDKGDHKPYYIQVAAFENFRAACCLVQVLRDLGYSAYCEFNKLDHGSSAFRIRIGKYRSRGEAERILLNLRQLGYRGFVSRK